MKNFRLLRADEIECRVSMVKATGVSLLLYKDARCDMNILDETVGMMNWKKEYSRDNRNCTVSIWDTEKQQWISKEDTGTESNTEAEKGLASDSFKRACFNWGIGRELYTAPFIWIGAENARISTKGSGYTCYDRFKVQDIDYDDNERISCLTITKDNKVVYTYGQKRSDRAALLSPAKQATLMNILKREGIDPEKVWKMYKVKDAGSLTDAKYQNIMEHIEEIKTA